MTARVCFICNDASKETRPYGAGGSPICWPCMNETPARQTEARRQLGKKYDACAGGPAILTREGPVPLQLGFSVSGKKKQ